MSSKIQAIRGMNDILPQHSVHWSWVETCLKQAVTALNYQEIRFPIVESTSLFKRTIGAVTDIVEKEMYTFDDLNGDSLTLRPEGTAGCVRACIEHGLLHNQIQKLWYLGPMFRHERPQKGRYRQFYQFGVEVFGYDSIAVDLELILLSKHLLESLGLTDSVSLEINTIGTIHERQQHKQALIEYFSLHQEQLDDDSKSRLQRNPLRILDSKNPQIKALVQDAPKLYDYLEQTSQKRFDTLCQSLEELGIRYSINPYLVRGLDYYCHTVFEWVTSELGAQGTVCAGGRYDGLVEQLGGKPTPGVGFAMGMERLVLLTQNRMQQTDEQPLVYFITTGLPAKLKALEFINQIVSQGGYRVDLNCSEASFKSQFKKADKSGAHYAVVIGEDEILKNTVGLKNMQQKSEQIMLAEDELMQHLYHKMHSAEIG